MRLRMRALSSIVGLCLFGLGTVGCWVLGGGHASFLIHIAPLLGIIVGSLGSSTLAFGLGTVLEAVSAIRLFFFASPSFQPSHKSLAVVRFLLVSVYMLGGLFSLFWLIMTLAAIAGPLEKIGERLAVAICSLIYAVLISEGLLRPLRNRLETSLLAGS